MPLIRDNSIFFQHFSVLCSHGENEFPGLPYRNYRETENETTFQTYIEKLVVKHDDITALIAEGDEVIVGGEVLYVAGTPRMEDGMIVISLHDEA